MVVAENFVPVTKQTVCYIVCGLVFNDHGEVLMMQEAKSSCYGMWYLPAGRMETNETIQVHWHLLPWQWVLSDWQYVSLSNLVNLSYMYTLFYIDLMF